jgi:YVTN family beta-propeller protein
VRIKYGLLAAIVVLCLAATVRAQYVEDSVDVGGAWVGSLAYNSREDVLYGASGSGVFFAISCDSNKVIKTMSLTATRAVACDSTHNKVYCTYGPADRESLAVIDGQTNAVLKTLAMPGAIIPVWDAVSDGIYISCASANKVAVVDGATDSLVKYIGVGDWPRGMYLNAIGRKLYVQNEDAGIVSIISLTTNSIIRNLNVGFGPAAGYYCQAVDKFYSGGGVGECFVISGQTDTIIARVHLPGSVDIKSAIGSETGGLVYLGTSDGGLDDYIATVSTLSDSLLSTAVVDGGPSALACCWSSGLVYCATVRRGWVYVLSNDGTRVLDSLPVDWMPSVFVQVPRHNRLYLGHHGSSYVYVLRDTSAWIAEPPSPRPALGQALRVMSNPFTRSIAVTRNSPALDAGALRVIAEDGRLVRHAQIPAGEARWVWDGRDDSGAPLPPGVYMLEAGPGVRAKVVKLR